MIRSGISEFKRILYPQNYRIVISYFDRRTKTTLAESMAQKSIELASMNPPVIKNFLENYKGLCWATLQKSKNVTDVPLIVILGSTGTGKTKLSIELAQIFNGEIINADSMQVYNGLDISTNKATEEERQGVPHHCIGMVHQDRQYTVVDFQKDAEAAIENIYRRNKLPIVVGGTNYYIECLLWMKTLLNEDSNYTSRVMGMDVFERFVEGPVTNPMPPPNSLQELLDNKIDIRHALHWGDRLHAFLAECDPEMAAKTSPNHHRRIVRYLKIFQKTRIPVTDLFAMQVQQTEGTFRGSLKYPNCVIFWLDCDRNILNDRLDKRCDEMLQRGLLEELDDFNRTYNSLNVPDGMPADYTQGIFQAIGLKEFHQYLMLTPDERSTYDGSLVLGRNILEFKQRTKSYVPKQLKWIRNRFLASEKVRVTPNVYRLRTDDPENWKSSVLSVAKRVIQLKLELVLNLYPSQYDRVNDLLNEMACERNPSGNEEFISGQFFCDLCQVNISGGKSYDMHLNSKGHRHLLMKRRKEAELKENEEQTPMSE